MKITSIYWAKQMLEDYSLRGSHYPIVWWHSFYVGVRETLSQTAIELNKVFIRTHLTNGKVKLIEQRIKNKTVKWNFSTVAITCQRHY